MSNLATAVITHLLSFFLGIVGHVFKQRLDPNARVVWARTHQFAFNLDGATQTAAVTQVFLVSNRGRAAAENVELVFAYRPQRFQIFPPREFSEVPLPEGHIIRFSRLAQKDEFSFNVLTMGQFPAVQPPVLIAVQSSAGVAREVPVQTQRVYPRWLRLIMVAVELIGFATVVYFVIQTGIIIWQRLSASAVWG